MWSAVLSRNPVNIHVSVSALNPCLEERAQRLPRRQLFGMNYVLRGWGISLPFLIVRVFKGTSFVTTKL